MNKGLQTEVLSSQKEVPATPTPSDHISRLWRQIGHWLFADTGQDTRTPVGLFLHYEVTDGKEYTEIEIK
jgi:hypothetical protein